MNPRPNRSTLRPARARIAKDTAYPVARWIVFAGGVGTGTFLILAAALAIANSAADLSTFAILAFGAAFVSAGLIGGAVFDFADATLALFRRAHQTDSDPSPHVLSQVSDRSGPAVK